MPFMPLHLDLIARRLKRGSYCSTKRYLKGQNAHPFMLCLTLVKLISRPAAGNQKKEVVRNSQGFVHNPFNAVYTATKAFILSFSEALREELRRSGVNICTVCNTLNFIEHCSNRPDTVLLGKKTLEETGISKSGLSRTTGVVSREKTQASHRGSTKCTYCTTYQ
ncbi:SDR family NAD(P)-dependent oxidoreductase [Prosthecochloris aestuarii]|uniref:SDR family NAD(P)-dependent oxidoreductase n=1 Tax=Prosthecochloris aestuarii TaxID=1102 RepID=UPI001232BB5D